MMDTFTHLPRGEISLQRLGFALIALKVLLLAIDPHVRFYLGDSASYIHSALFDWVPPDRSYLYALLIRATAVTAQSLYTLILTQSMFGVGTALVLYWIASSEFGLRRDIAALLALLFSIGPEQLFYERMVMAESTGALLLALQLASGLLYLRERRWYWLVAGAVLGLGAAVLRMNLLPLVLGFCVVPPIAAMSMRTGESKPRARWMMFVLHFVIAIAAVGICHSAYKHWYAARAGVKHADYYTYSGYFKLGLVSPLIQERDLKGLDLPSDFLSRIKFPLEDRDTRESQIWNKDGFVDVLRATVGDLAGARLANKIAGRALHHDPLGLVRLGFVTASDYFKPERTTVRMTDDLGAFQPPGPEMIVKVRNAFHYDAEGVNALPTPIFDYFGASGPWLTACYLLLAPLALVTIILEWKRRRSAGILLGLAALGAVAAQILFAYIMSFRYLHTFPFFIFLCIGAIFASFQRWREPDVEIPRT
jgi:Dolichyl-phosphate-mannose-protein mannosyltransferase